MSIPRLRAAGAAIALLLLAACGSDGTGPVVKQTADLNIVLQAPTAPTLTSLTRSVWVKKGVQGELRLYYRSLASGADSTEFLRLSFDQRSLLRRPDGSAIATGDSVLVTVVVPDPTKFLVDLQPTGLKFDPDRPVEMRWKLANRDRDLNDDGLTNDTDLSLFTTLAIWRQESVGQPWVRLGSTLETEIDEISVDLSGFSNYVVAY